MSALDGGRDDPRRGMGEISSLRSENIRLRHFIETTEPLASMIRANENVELGHLRAERDRLREALSDFAVRLEHGLQAIVWPGPAAKFFERMIRDAHALSRVPPSASSTEPPAASDSPAGPDVGRDCRDKSLEGLSPAELTMRGRCPECRALLVNVETACPSCGWRAPW